MYKNKPYFKFGQSNKNESRDDEDFQTNWPTAQNEEDDNSYRSRGGNRGGNRGRRDYDDDSNDDSYGRGNRGQFDRDGDRGHRGGHRSNYDRDRGGDRDRDEGCVQILSYSSLESCFPNRLLSIKNISMVV